ncbi:MAG: mannose-1-phosphate guanylyltransferase/mannose-6-phosphate isomerase, partial [Salinisphaera sp.]|nr:mannose-1-phosphate guanylyltransferase/mannose-6-phosphate isomerase [Salinisphaera sp.]
MLVPVVLAGGSGTRLWPASRAARPKQFLPLVGQGSLLEQTLRRAAAVAPDGRPLIVGQERHRFLIAEHSRRAGATATVMLEPVGRNTAPAVAACAFEALASVGPEARLLVLPSDHVIGDAPGFARAVACAAAAARDGHLVTFGVTVTGPETGYGYIRAGAQSTNGAHRIEAFVEKPGRETAELYLADGGYYWNSGMFLFGAQVYLDALQALAPDILDAVRKAHEQASRETDFLRLEANAFAGCRPDSIDYAVMEKTRDAVVVPLSAPWSDLGSWSAVAAAGSLDGQGNALYGDVIVQETCDSIIRSDGRLVAALGVRDTVIVETPDAVLVADRSREQ